MTTILKKEWTISFWFTIIVLFLISLTTLGGGAPLHLTFIFTIILLSHLFQTDEKSKVNVYLASLPIERKVIVRGRYIFLALFVLGMVTFGFLANKLIPNLSTTIEWSQQFTIVVSALVCTILLILLSFILPIFYRFTFGIATLIFIGSVGFLSLLSFVSLFWKEGFLVNWLNEHIFSANYIPLALGIAILLFWLSYKISVAIFEKKELRA